MMHFGYFNFADLHTIMGFLADSAWSDDLWLDNLASRLGGSGGDCKWIAGCAACTFNTWGGRKGGIALHRRRFGALIIMAGHIVIDY